MDEEKSGSDSDSSDEKPSTRTLRKRKIATETPHESDLSDEFLGQSSVDDAQSDDRDLTYDPQHDLNSSRKKLKKTANKLSLPPLNLSPEEIMDDAIAREHHKGKRWKSQHGKGHSGIIPDKASIVLKEIERNYVKENEDKKEGCSRKNP